MSMLLVIVLAQVLPPVGSSPLTFPVGADIPARLVMPPAVTWSGSTWMLAWRDQRVSSSMRPTFFAEYDGGAQAGPPEWLRGSESEAVVEPLRLASTRETTVLVYPVHDGTDPTLVARTRTVGGWSAPVPVGGPLRVPISVALASSGDEVFLAALEKNGQLRLKRFVQTQSDNAVSFGATASDLSLGIDDGGVRLGATLNGQGVLRTIDPSNLGLLGQLLDAGPVPLQAVSAVGAPTVTVLRNNSLELLRSSSSGWVALQPPAPIAAPTFTVPIGPLFFEMGAGGTIQTVYRAQVLSTQSWSALTPQVGSPLAVASNGQVALALLSRGGELTGYVVEPAPFGITSRNVPVIRVPAAQRAPALVWSELHRRFVAVWNEEVATGLWAVRGAVFDETSVRSMPIASAPVANVGQSMTPGVPFLSADEGTGELRLVAGADTTRASSTLSIAQAALALDAPVSIQTLVGLDVANGHRLTLEASGIAVDSRSLSSVSWLPSCIGEADGSWFVPIAISASPFELWRVDQRDGGIAKARIPFAPTGAPCATVWRRGGTSELAVGAPTAQGFQVFGYSLDFDGGQQLLSGSQQPESAMQLVGGHDVVAALWVSGGLVKMQSVSFGTTSPIVELSDGVEAAHLASASNSGGLAAIAWDAVDPREGNRRIELRLLWTGPDGGLDAGPQVDAGSLVDAGTAPVDAGTEVDAGGFIDAGPAPVDAGTQVDAGGLIDAGAFDGGSADGGGPPIVQLVPACGCSGTGLELVAVFLAALVVRAGRKRANCPLR